MGRLWWFLNKESQRLMFSSVLKLRLVYTLQYSLVSGTLTRKLKSPIAYVRCFPGGSDGKVSACNAGDPGSSPGSGRWREWQSIPALLPGKSHGWRSLIGYSPWGRKESDTTEQLHFLCFFLYVRYNVLRLILPSLTYDTYIFLIPFIVVKPTPYKT